MARVLPSLTVLVVLLSVNGAGEEPGEDLGGEKRALVEEAIGRLGAASYQDRQEASEWLWAAGPEVSPSLREALAGGDPEVTMRVRVLLERFRLGIEPDTPSETEEMIRRYDGVEAEARIEILKTLKREDKLVLILRLICLEEDPSVRRRLLWRFIGSGSSLLAILRAENREDEITEFLKDLYPRDWVVYQILRGDAGEELRQLRERVGEGLTVEEKTRLAWLLIVNGILDEAGKVIEQLDDPGLLTELHHRRFDWKSLIEGDLPFFGKETDEGLGFTAAYHELAGNRKEADKVVDALFAKTESDERRSFTGTTRLLILGRWDLANRLMMEGEIPSPSRIKLLSARRELLATFDGFHLEADEKNIAGALARQLEEQPLVEAEEEIGGETRTWLRSMRELGRVLEELGEPDQARELYLAIAGHEEAGNLPGLAKSLRELGHGDDARELEMRALHAGEAEAFFRARCEWRRARACRFWWKFFRAEHPDAPPERTLEMVEAALEREGEEGDGDRSKLVGAAEKWIERQEEKEHRALKEDLARACGLAGLTRPAVRLLEEVAAETERPWWLLMHAGDILAEAENWPEAARLYDAAARCDRQKCLAPYLSGHALLQAGQEAEGKTLMDAAVFKPLSDDERRGEFAYELGKRGHREEAARQWELVRCAGRYGSGPHSYYLNHCFYRFAGEKQDRDPAVAADYLEKYLLSLLRTGTFFNDSRSYLRVPARIHRLRCRGYLAEGEIEAAIASARKALSALPGDVEFLGSVAGPLDDAGRGKLVDEWFADMAARCRAILERFPNSVIDHDRLARLCLRTGRELGEGVRHAEQATRLRPDHAAHFGTLADLYLALGETGRAIEAARTACNLDPEDENHRKRLEDRLTQ